jgi:hypothetical protein
MEDSVDRRKTGVDIRVSRVLGPTEKTFDGKKLELEPRTRWGIAIRSDCNGKDRPHPVFTHCFQILREDTETGTSIWAESFYEAREQARILFGPTAHVVPID